MARLNDLTIDCRHPASLARFWAAALEDYEVAPYDEVELERLHSLGINDPEDDPNVLVESGDHPLRLWFQQVPEPKAAKNRVHLDLRVENVDDEVARLTALGARVLSDDGSNVVCSDPEGNEFCISASR